MTAQMCPASHTKTLGQQWSHFVLMHNHLLACRSPSCKSQSRKFQKVIMSMCHAVLQLNWTCSRARSCAVTHRIVNKTAGYCQISCGRCLCCPTLAQAAGNASLTEFLWAVNHSSPGVLENLNQPGLLATVLAPTDGAMQSLYDKLGRLLVW